MEASARAVSPAKPGREEAAGRTRVIMAALLQERPGGGKRDAEVNALRSKSSPTRMVFPAPRKCARLGLEGLATSEAPGRGGP
ncbi:hypothetical protein MPLA_160052 [Mesorhizobium sp. ORS 3359]|nr:hypothetical protein MPLA_160052 [Mesorhizobium sp. ORS 3359]